MSKILRPSVPQWRRAPSQEQETMYDDMDKAYATDEKGTELDVLVLICRHANKDGLSWVSIPTMAQKLKKHERTISRAINKLAKHRRMDILYKRGPNGCNVYRPTLTTLRQLCHGGDPDNPDNRVTHPDIPDH